MSFRGSSWRSLRAALRTSRLGPPENPPDGPPGPVWGVFGGSKTGCPKGRPETPPRRSTTRSKSTHSSRLCSVSLSSVLFCLVLLRDVVVGKFFCLRPEVGLDFLLRPQVGLQHSHSTFDRSRWTRSRCRSVRSSSVNRRRATVDFGRIQKPARHRCRSENESFAQTDATHNYQVSFF